MIKSETNAKKAWIMLKKYKPRGSSILNTTFRRLESINLAAYNNDPYTYANVFVEVLEEFETLFSKLYFDKNWKIYRFYSGLGLIYDSYCEQYN